MAGLAPNPPNPVEGCAGGAPKAVEVAVVDPNPPVLTPPPKRLVLGAAACPKRLVLGVAACPKRLVLGAAACPKADGAPPNAGVAEVEPIPKPGVAAGVAFGLAVETAPAYFLFI